MGNIKPIYTATLFLSAVLLFSVQPMIGKALLPLMGGGPSIWNTAMVFFQLLLLGGYFYAFLVSKLPSIRLQGAIHALMIVLAAALALPLTLSPASELDPAEPLKWQLLTMMVMIAAPFFVLAASAPLLQRWFSLSPRLAGRSPYSLYAASNAGSLLALLAYPFVMEPLLRLDTQATLWTFGYGLLALLGIVAFTGSGFSKTAPVSARLHFIDADPEADAEAVAEMPPDWRRRFMWILLAFVPSSLMIGYTTYITTDVTSVPLFWVIPLALYLLSFIIAFSDRPIITLDRTRYLHTTFIMFFIWMLLVGVAATRWPILIIHGGLFFFTALLCHQEMVRLKPSPRHLTEFYLLMSMGGALGGMFNSLLAPLIFPLPYEYLIAIGLGMLARFSSDEKNSTAEDVPAKTFWDYLFFPGLLVLGGLCAFANSLAASLIVATIIVIFGFNLHFRRWAFAVTIIGLILCKPLIPWNKLNDKLLISRNFYGIHMVDNVDGLRKLTHGTTVHGAQALDPALALTPLTYYYKASGGANIFHLLSLYPGPQKIAALGLGSGSVACFSHPGRSFDFYEIDPQVPRIVEDPSYFTFLSKCGSPYKIIMGDARQQIAHAPDHSYDLIFVDVFSSDNIPIHIMTKEAVALYRQKLKTGGLIVFHISNRYFHLETELAKIARALDLPALYKVDGGGPVPGSQGLSYYPTKYVVMTENPEYLSFLNAAIWVKLSDATTGEPWSDGYANILRAMRF